MLCLMLVALGVLPVSAGAAVTGVLYTGDPSTGQGLAISPVDGSILETFPCYGDVSAGPLVFGGDDCRLAVTR